MSALQQSQCDGKTERHDGGSTYRSLTIMQCCAAPILDDANKIVIGWLVSNSELVHAHVSFLHKSPHRTSTGPAIVNKIVRKAARIPPVELPPLWPNVMTLLRKRSLADWISC